VVALLRKAEDALKKKAGQSDPNTRVCTLRGIYYGTEWSLDFKVERKRSEAGARIRNAGFLTYTGGNLPADPRPALGQSLFDDLQASQSIHDGGYGIDVGHVLIGLETRSSANLRTQKFSGQGGTGLEIVTWLGDLGGGAASLARKRIAAPQTSVSVIFNNSSSDYGVMDNLEGDLGGYLVACGAQPGGAPAFAGSGAADSLAAYAPLASRTEWNSRAARFITAIGGKVSARGQLLNPLDLVKSLTAKLYEFAVWYAATRWIPSGELLGKDADRACQHMRSAAGEVALTLTQTLVKAIAAPTRPVAASAPYTSPVTPGVCESTLLQAASKDPASVKKQLQEWGKDLAKLFD
jgi:hypothetical protein